MSIDNAANANRNDDRKRPMNRTRRLLFKALIAATGCVAATALVAPAAHAAFGFANFGVSTRIDGEVSRQAGAHADLRTSFNFNRNVDTFYVDGNVKNVSVALPPGFVGNPTAAPTCPVNKLIKRGAVTDTECPGFAQIGMAFVEFGFLGYNAPLFNIAHSGESPGLFGANVFGTPVFVEPTVRAGDYGVSALSARTSQAEPIEAVDITIWGVPGDPIHDPQRIGPNPFPRRPFLSNTTSCGGRVSFGIEANSWQHPEAVVRTSVSSDLGGTPLVYTGCDRLGFEPSIEVQPGTHRAHAPTGLNFDLKLPQNEGPDGLATAHVKKTVVTFPKGVTVSSSSVAGLGACSLAEIGLGSNAEPTCPDSSKIGNVTIRTQVLDEPLEGEVILARQNENPFHSLFAIYLVAKGPGFYLKLPGELNVDKQTGQLKTIVDNTPQLPFEELQLDFRGGPTAPLQTPDICGTYQTHTEMTSWASANPVTVDSPMVIDENCTGGGAFRPGLQAGVANPVAGANSPLTFRVTRQDGEQNLSRIEATLPEGELAKLAGVVVCPDAIAATGACPLGSQVGIATNAIGTGAFPLFIPQLGKDPTALYLGGPYKGAPYSLITKVPAQSGPFDFGVIVVRSAINVNPITSQAIIKSDPLPQILEGVPISYRDVRIEVQKPDFTVNPTSCEQRYVTTTLTSIEGATAHPSTPFKVGDCASLGFSPKLTFKVQGGTNRGDYQALTAILTTKKHQANISRVAVTLPHSEFLAQEHIRTICTRVQFAAKKCPDASIYGFAKATTPLLDKPLEGPVYLRSSSNPLPDLVATLNGQFDIELAGRIDSVKGGIRNTFDVVPDAPVSRFVLKMKGGEKSLLVNSRNLCKSTSKAEVKMIGQNGKHFNSRPVLIDSCGKSSPKSKR